MNNKDPYAFGSQQLEPTEDQRDEFRLVGRASISLELESAEPGEGAQSRVAPAESADVSASGLRVVTREPLTPGALLPAIIQLQGEPPCALTVEVVWCRSMDANGWQSGLRIMDTGDGDYVVWIEAVAKALEGG